VVVPSFWLSGLFDLGKFCNKRELSEILGISERSLTEWQADGMPIQAMADARGAENTYDTEACIRWWIEREVRRRSTGSSDEALNNVRYQREVLALKRDLGELVDASEVRPALEAWRDDVLATLLGIPEKFAQRIEIAVGIDAKRQLLEEMVGEMRDVMGSYDDGTGPGPADSSRISQSAEDHRHHVG
jgi:phage terminase Nu1 subunit (DNA packaging protein)